MKTVIQILSIFLFATLAFAQQGDFNYDKMNYGTQTPFISARSMGMGGSGVAGGTEADAAALNPALIGENSSLITFTGGLWLNRHIEDRAFPYYDSFVGFNDYGSYYYHAKWYQGFWGMAVFNIPFPQLQGINVAAGVLPFSGFDYDYEEEVRDPADKSDRLLGYNTIKQQGAFTQIPLIVAYRALPGLYVAGQVSLVRGQIDASQIINPHVADFESIAMHQIHTKKLDKTPLVSTLGLRYRMDERLTVGASVRLPYSLSFKRSFTDVLADTAAVESGQTLDYPLRFAAGLEYRFENILAAKINLDFVYDLWSQFKDNLKANTRFQDTYSFRVGVEHLFFDKVPLRAGFLYSTLRQSASFSRAVLTIGSGFTVRQVQINFGGGVSNMDYYQADMFPDSMWGLNDRSDSDRVKLTNYFLRADVTCSFDSK